MTDIEQKALALVNEIELERGAAPYTKLNRHNHGGAEAIFRAIEQHEATKQELADFRQEVSDAVSKAIRFCKDGRPASAAGAIGAFVIPAPKPDPLVDAMNDIGIGVYENIKTEYADTLRADLVRRFRSALEARGFEIRKKNDG